MHQECRWVNKKQMCFEVDAERTEKSTPSSTEHSDLSVAAIAHEQWAVFDHPW